MLPSSHFPAALFILKENSQSRASARMCAGTHVFLALQHVGTKDEEETMYQLKRNELEWEYIDKNLGIRFTVPGECTAKLLLTPDAEAVQSEADVEESVKNPRYGQSLRKIAEKSMPGRHVSWFPMRPGQSPRPGSSDTLSGSLRRRKSPMNRSVHLWQSASIGMRRRRR